MATLEELKASLDGIKEDFATLSDSTLAITEGIDSILATVQALKDQIAGGSPVSQADLDALVADAQAVDAAGDEVKAALDAAKAKLVP